MSMISAMATGSRRRAARLLVPLMLLPILALLRPSAPEALVAASPIVGIAAHPSGEGYWVVGQDGGIFTFGNIPYYGSMGGRPLAAPIVGMAVHPSGAGYWLVASDGGIFTFGNIAYHGSMGGRSLVAPMVGMAAHPGGGGYWTVAADGGMFTFGNIPFYGSIGGKRLDKPVVGMAVHPDGSGYWEVASDGGIFTFGNIPFYGSMGGQPLASPVTGMAVHPSGLGYWLVARDGGIFTFGNIPYYGSVPGIGTETPGGGGGGTQPPLPPGGWIDNEQSEFASSTAIDLNSYGHQGLWLDGGEQSYWKVSNTGGTSNGLPEGGTCNFSPGMTIWDADFATQTNKAFDHASVLFVNSQPFHSSQTFIDGERSFRTGPKLVDGVKTSLQYYSATQTATLRTFASFQNTSTVTTNLYVTWANNVAFNSDTVLQRTSSSSAPERFLVDDRWVVLGHRDSSENPLNLTFAYRGPDDPNTFSKQPLAPADVTGTGSSALVPGTSEPVFACPSGQTEGANVGFSLTLQPGETKSLLFFQDLNGSLPEAEADAARYNDVNSMNLGSDLLRGLTAIDLARVANWEFNFNRWVLTGPGEQGGPRFRMWGADLSGTTGALKLHSSALSEGEETRGGVQVAGGNLDSDTFTEIATASGPNAGPPRVKLWDVGPTTGLVTQTVTITAADPSFTGGLTVALGNLDGLNTPVEHTNEVVVGLGPTPGTDTPVKIYRVTATASSENQRLVASFVPFPGYEGGVNVAAGNVDAQAGDEILVGTMQGEPRLAIFKVDSAFRVFRQMLKNEGDFVGKSWINPFPGFTGGISVGAGTFDDQLGEEIVVGRLSESSNHNDVRVLKLEDGTIKGLLGLNVFGGKGAYVASGNLLPTAGSFRDELVVGAPPGYGPPLVRMYKFAGTSTSLSAMSACGSGGECEFRVYNTEFTGGVRVAGIREDVPTD